jgi:hypothetical protein
VKRGERIPLAKMLSTAMAKRPGMPP